MIILWGCLTLVGLKPGSATESVYSYLKNEIIHQRLTPGTQLVERVFCDILNVGHTSVRRAFEALQDDGYVQISPYKGAFVSEFTKLQIIQLCNFRIELQIYALSLCIDTFTEDDFNILNSYIDKEMEAFNDSDFAKYLDALSLFHCYIVDKAKNPYLSEAFLTTLNRVSVYLALYDNFYHTGKPKSIVNHRNLVTAIQNQKIKKAKSILETISNGIIDIFEFRAINPK